MVVTSVNINKLQLFCTAYGGNNPDVLKAAIDGAMFQVLICCMAYPRPNERAYSVTAGM